MIDRTTQATSLKFPLHVEDDWPPVAVESLPFVRAGTNYKLLEAPLFIKDLSVNDVICVNIDECNMVTEWQHILRSNHTTLWVLRLATPNTIQSFLNSLRELGCNTVSFNAAGVFSVDIPGSVSMKQVDNFICFLDEKSSAVAFPSMRHPLEA